jgi:hypothetical protein
MTAGYWNGPSDEVAGVVVPLPRTLVRRTDIGLALTHATAYPNGFLLHARYALPADVELYPEALRIRVDSPTPGPQVTPWHGSSSGDAHGQWGEFALWLSPLPPPGPVTLSWQWAERGIARSTFELDGAAVVTAAGQAQPLRR